jgi:hypothetical protein
LCGLRSTRTLDLFQGVKEGFLIDRQVRVVFTGRRTSAWPFSGSFLVDEHEPAPFQGVTKSFRVGQAVRECLSRAEKLPRQSTLAQPNQIQRTTIFVPYSVTHHNQLSLNTGKGQNSTTDLLYQSGPSGGRREIIGDGELAFALVTIACRLRLYLQAHSMEVLTDCNEPVNNEESISLPANKPCND